MIDLVKQISAFLRISGLISLQPAAFLPSVFRQLARLKLTYVMVFFPHILLLCFLCV